MSLRSAALAGLLVVGSATAMASVPANAATTTCGFACISLMPEIDGPADFVAAGQGYIVQHGSDVGQPANLATAGPVPSEDWQAQDLGTAAQLAAAGIVTPIVGRTWPAAEALQYSWAPDGLPSGLCLGVAGTASLGTPVSLQPCGVSAGTVWVKIAKSYFDRYGPLVSGTDTRTFLPYTLTAGSPGSQLVTSFLIGTSVRNYSPTQMWGTWLGAY